MTTERKTMDTPTAGAPLLRTLSPALHGLEKGLRSWLDSPRSYPLSTMARANLEGLAADLRRQAEALDVDKPLLVIMFMGGTGVGKSTLLNALAGGDIAQASFARPTTRDPVVYYHESLSPERLDPALRYCRLVPHDRPELEQKILVDTPDLDSNDLANRDKLMHLLPVADVVLYVGSQEKYHDKLGWDLFLHQRKRRAFAFVLNKWDRCLYGKTSGVSPDEDLLADLKREGFESPLLFRTCAQAWVDRRNGKADGHPPLPEGEQYPELVRWLEAGLKRLEIEAIKARGVGQLLDELARALAGASPPDLTEVARRTRAAWERPLKEEAEATAAVLLDTLEPYQREIEHHFALEGQSRFHGLMAGYLRLFTRAKYVGSNLSGRVPFLPGGKKKEEHLPAWDLTMITRACSDVAGNRHLDARGRALANRLLVAADNQGFPLELLTEPVEELGEVDWRQRHAQTLSEVLRQVEREWTRPTGWRRWVHGGVVFLANWLPLIALLASLIALLWRIFYPYDGQAPFNPYELLVPAVVVLVVLILMHVLISLLLPLRWVAIRGEFQDRLEARLREELEGVYAPVPGKVAETLAEERRRVEKLAKEVGEVAEWLTRREQLADIAGLYGRGAQG
jgi:hypothetical protein